MSVIALTINIDDREWSRRLAHIGDALRPAIASAITSTAREGRKAFARELPPDAVGGKKGSISKALAAQFKQPTVASPASLTSISIIKPSRFDVMPLLRSSKPGNMYKPGGATVSTWIATGGGSASLFSPKFFVLRANSGEVILERKKSVAGLGRKAGRRLTKQEVKKIYAEQPISAFKQDFSRPRIAWTRAIDTNIVFRVGGAVQEVFNGGGSPALVTEG